MKEKDNFLIFHNQYDTIEELDDESARKNL